MYKVQKKVSLQKVTKDTVPKRDYNIILPYLGPLSNRIQRRIKIVFQMVIPTGKINIIFKTKRRLSHILKFKDLISTDLNSHVIYHFNCSSCNAGYIGETRVHYKIRQCQHLGISAFTGNPVRGGVPTAVNKHMSKNKCVCSLSDFEIIGREDDYHRRLIKESLFINLYNYELNKQQKSTELFLF